MDLIEKNLQAASPYGIAGLIAETATTVARPGIPDYLKRYYWWAYISPKAVFFFEQRWLVNLILLGNYDRLARAAIDRIEVEPGTTVLQIACAYGELTSILAKKIEAADARLHVVDVLPIQLANLSDKLGADSQVQLSCMDSCDLKFGDETFDSILLFFLMHEQPDEVRQTTLMEACRILKPGGKIILADYSSPSDWNPMRYFMYFLLKKLEPFALDLWVKDALSWLPKPLCAKVANRKTFFGGMYQVLEITK